jgi:hypothetical protein
MAKTNGKANGGKKVTPKKVTPKKVTLPEALKLPETAGPEANGEYFYLTDTEAKTAGGTALGTPEDLAKAIQQTEEEKEKAIKFIYGPGGQTWSILPILLDRKVNPFLDTHFPITAGRVTQQTLEEWKKANGTITIIPIQGGEWTFYTVAILPAKQTTIKPWELKWGRETGNFLQYTEYKEAEKGIMVTPQQYLITNITTNRGKAINQAKALGKVFKLDTSTVEDKAKVTYTITPEGKILQANKNNGLDKKEYNSISDIIGRQATKHYTWNNLVKAYTGRA